MELFQEYTIEQIIVMLIMLVCCIKGVVDFYEWVKEKLNKFSSEKIKETQEKTQYEEHLLENKESFDILFKQQQELFKKIEKLTDDVDALIKSDKDAIKSFITEKHHFFCYKRKWIDDYSLDCIEKRFEHYIEEGGNSYVESLMADIRELPKHKIENKDSE